MQDKLNLPSGRPNLGSGEDDGGFEKQERIPDRYSLKRILPRTLFARSLLILIVPILLIQIVTAAMFFDRHLSKVTTRLAFAVAGEINVIVSMVEDSDGALDVVRFDSLSAHAREHLSLRVDYDADAVFVDKDIREGGVVWEPEVAKTLKREIANKIQRPFAVKMDFEAKEARVDVDMSAGVLSVEFPQRRLFSSSGYVFLLWVFGSSILLVGISVIFMRNQIRPIRKLAAAAKRLGQGRDVPSFKPEGAREVRQASQAFIDMHRRIKRQVSQRTAMLAGVSHDLRTPLTRLKLQLSMMDGKDAEDMRSDINEMERMISGYLDFVRGDGAEPTRITDMNAVFDKLVYDAAREDVRIHSDVQGSMQAMIRPLTMERCLSNLITNAAKYGSQVWLSAHINDARKLVIFIEDDGPGMPEDEYEAVFKPFYRVDQSRNSDTGGVGLGLSIAMDAIHGHGGKIWLESSVHGGLRVCIRIPV